MVIGVLARFSAHHHQPTQRIDRQPRCPKLFPFFPEPAQSQPRDVAEGVMNSIL